MCPRSPCTVPCTWTALTSALECLPVPSVPISPASSPRREAGLECKQQDPWAQKPWGLGSRVWGRIPFCRSLKGKSLDLFVCL